MKIVEALKLVKANKLKIADLQKKIAQQSAHLSTETPLYGADTAKVVKGWIQSIHDIANENIRLLTAIQKTNLETQVTIQLGDTAVTNSIAHWVWRRREYAKIDLDTMACLSDRGLKEQLIQSTTGGEPTKISIVRNFDPLIRDKFADIYRSEPFAIDSTLEIINAVTDLVE